MPGRAFSGDAPRPLAPRDLRGRRCDPRRRRPVERTHARWRRWVGLGLAGDSGRPDRAGPAGATLNYLCRAAPGRGSYRSPRPPHRLSRALTWLDVDRSDAPFAAAVAFAGSASGCLQGQMRVPAHLRRHNLLTLWRALTATTHPPRLATACTGSATTPVWVVPRDSVESAMVHGPPAYTGTATIPVQLIPSDSVESAPKHAAMPDNAAAVMAAPMSAIPRDSAESAMPNAATACTGSTTTPCGWSQAIPRNRRQARRDVRHRCRRGGGVSICQSARFRGIDDARRDRVRRRGDHASAGHPPQRRDLRVRAGRTIEPSTDFATLQPSSSLAPVLDALTYACWLHVVPPRMNTSTAPDNEAALLAWLPPMPVAALSSMGAPTARVEPSADNSMVTPNSSIQATSHSQELACDALMYASKLLTLLCSKRSAPVALPPPHGSLPSSHGSPGSNLPLPRYRPHEGSISHVRSKARHSW